MNNTIKVLEAIAQQSGANIEKLLIEAELNAEQAEAIINKDITSLERQLDICPDIVCTFIPAEDEEPEEDSDNDENSDNDIKSVINI